jgi:alpha-D-ribose 1-methylphosphonate 5-phosphate C-P lyase
MPYAETSTDFTDFPFTFMVKKFLCALCGKEVRLKA